MADEVIKGYRVVGERPKDRSLSYEYLKQDGKSAKLLAVLRTAAVREGANCLGKAEKWTGDELPSDREAQLMCATCPLVQMCSQYAEGAHVAHGVWGGKVYGRRLAEAMKDE